MNSASAMSMGVAVAFALGLASEWAVGIPCGLAISTAMLAAGRS
jgi:hypothetical protein